MSSTTLDEHLLGAFRNGAVFAIEDESDSLRPIPLGRTRIYNLPRKINDISCLNSSM